MANNLSGLDYHSVKIMRTFDKVWEEQKSFQYNFFNPDNMSEEEKILHTKENILSIHRELGEVLNVIPWKTHRSNKKAYDEDHLKEELIDCFKFLLNVCIIHGMTAESFIDLFFSKSEIVKKRYKAEKDNI